ncbi:MAG: DUF4115 domain-containing protein [Syntrophomonadaceae bacterium]|nr:DUF4115 domain-containing protein [Syntrophomonadaceae bacterium]MDD3888307.1 DUF4115 domain-containing protein [Syntrophomonadaceae bacterium]
MGLGEKFREEREKQGYSLQIVEEETKIRKLYLEAIEKEDFVALPPKVYAVGFVKRYAKFLHLDEKELVDQFKELAYSGEINEEPEVITTDTKKLRIPLKNIAAGIIFLVLAVWIGNYLADYFSLRGSENLPDNNLPNIQNSQDKGDTKQPGVGKEPVKTEEKVSLLVTAEQDCWLYVKVDGEKAFEAILIAGNSELFEGKESVYIKAGNAGGISIKFNEGKAQPLGDYGEVKEKEFTITK